MFQQALMDIQNSAWVKSLSSSAGKGTEQEGAGGGDEPVEEEEEKTYEEEEEEDEEAGGGGRFRELQWWRHRQ